MSFFIHLSKVINQFIRIKFGFKPLNRVEYIKYLGILVDSKLETSYY